MTTPRFRIRADVLHYIVMVVVGAGGAYGFSRLYGQSDEEIESELRAKYPLQIKKSENQHQQMQEFFNKMKNSDKELDEKFSGILKAGRGEMKRHYELEPAKESLAKPVVRETPVTPNVPAAPTATPSSSTGKESTGTATGNGWWNGWGWW